MDAQPPSPSQREHLALVHVCGTRVTIVTSCARGSLTSHLCRCCCPGLRWRTPPGRCSGWSPPGGCSETGGWREGAGLRWGAGPWRRCGGTRAAAHSTSASADTRGSVGPSARSRPGTRSGPRVRWRTPSQVGVRTLAASVWDRKLWKDNIWVSGPHVTTNSGWISPPDVDAAAVLPRRSLTFCFSETRLRPHEAS